MTSCDAESQHIPESSAPDLSSFVENQLNEPESRYADPKDYQTYIDHWASNHEINSDYIGEIWFDSNIINLPMVQGETNDTYLRTNWETMDYDVYGSIFMDYRNTFDDQNLIIYGHFSWPNMDPDRVIMFTPLEKLIDSQNYEENSHFNILLENQIRKYQVAYVYYCPIYTDSTGFQYTAENTQYYLTEYSPDYLKTYTDAITDLEFYDTGVELTPADNLVTLQTCVYNRDDLRLIVIAKEIERIEWR